MKKIILLVALLQGAFSFCNGKTVDENTAKSVGYSFLSRSGSTVANTGDLQMVYEATTNVNGATLPCFYVFNVVSSKGFVIVSGDDNVTPILGYSTQNMFQAQNMATNVAGWLGNYQKQISAVITQGIPATGSTSENWSTLISGKMLAAAKTTSVSPLITTQWDQEPYYNALCPYDVATTQLTVTGCVATAMAQVMKFWSYPKTGSGMHTYIDPLYGTQTANFGDATLAWASMPLSISSANSAIAKLMYEVGVSVDMHYNIAANDGSGSYVTSASSPVINCAEYALRTYFNYDPALKGLSRSDYPTESQWTSLIETELNANRPVIYSGQGTVGGHCWACDGYDATGKFHFNFGWSGQSDGYYTVDNIAPPALGAGGSGGNFDADQGVIVGIQPPVAGTASASAIKMNAFIVNNTSSPIPYGSPFSLTTKFTNTGSASFSGDFCALVYNAAGSVIDTLKMISAQTVAASASTATLTFNTTTGLHNMTSGLYHVQFYSRPTGGTWSLIADNTVSSSSYINYSNVSIGDQDDGIYLSSAIQVTQNGAAGTSLITGKPVTVTADISNPFTAAIFSGTVDASLYSIADGSKVYTIEQLTNQTILSGSANFSFTSANNLNINAGTYVLMITDENSTQSSFETTGSIYYSNPVLVNVVYPTGVEEVTADNAIKIYPNPASSFITIDMGGTDVSAIRIMDIAGRQVINTVAAQNQQSVTVPVANMAPGMYFVELSTQQGIITRKVVVR